MNNKKGILNLKVDEFMRLLIVPDGTTFVDCRYNAFRNCIEVLLSHDDLFLTPSDLEPPSVWVKVEWDKR